MSIDWNFNDYNPFHFGTAHRLLLLSQFLVIALPALAVGLFYLRRKGRSAGYLLCFCLFSIYLWELASFTVFPFPLSFGPRGFDHAGLHLVPALLEGDPSFRLQSEQVYGNFLAGVPFGFALPFVIAPQSSTPRRVMALGLALALAPELIQLVQNVLFVDFGSRSVDIDDVWLCFAGTLSGYGVLRAAAHVYRRLGWSRGAGLPVWDHFHEVLLRVASNRAPPVDRPGHEEQSQERTAGTSRAPEPS